MDTLALSDGEFGVTFCLPLRSDGWLESFIVRIDEPGLHAAVRVENSGVIQGADAFFHDIAQHWRGWTGEKSWDALEGELNMSATADSVGHITIRVQLRPMAGPGSWRAISYAYVESGQLESLARRATKFFGREP